MITSIHNPKILHIRDLLAHANARREAGAFVVEGVRLVGEAHQSGWEAELVLVTEDLTARGQSIAQGYAMRGIMIETVSKQVMKRICATETPQGILAILRLIKLPIPPEPDFVVILDGLRDPGNLGTVLRSAAAAGVQAVLLAPGTTDAFAPKVMRSAMGAHFHLPVLLMSWPEIAAYVKPTEILTPLTVYLADSSGGVVYTRADFRNPSALIIGGEAEGAGSEAQSLADARVHISMPGNIESLNAAVSAALLMFEVVRQRADR